MDNLYILDTLDLTQTLTKARYARDLAKLQGRLALLTRHPRFTQHNVVCVFEGMDAAGKGGAIRRVTAALDARLYHTIPVAAPTDEEKAQPYLWRFWRHIPGKGRFTIYDRSWYGRVLVERIEGFCSEADWMRAYSEINEFEDQLSRNGTVVLKFWMQISKSEQLQAVQAARADAVQAVQDHRRGLAQPREVERVSDRRSRHDRTHQHRQRAVDADRVE